MAGKAEFQEYSRGCLYGVNESEIFPIELIRFPIKLVRFYEDYGKCLPGRREL